MLQSNPIIVVACIGLIHFEISAFPHTSPSALGPSLQTCLLSQCLSMSTSMAYLSKPTSDGHPPHEASSPLSSQSPLQPSDTGTCCINMHLCRTPSSEISTLGGQDGEPHPTPSPCPQNLLFKFIFIFSCGKIQITQNLSF